MSGNKILKSNEIFIFIKLISTKWMHSFVNRSLIAMIINTEQCFYLRPQNCLIFTSVAEHRALASTGRVLPSLLYFRLDTVSFTKLSWGAMDTMSNKLKREKKANSVQFLNHIKKHKYISLYCLEHQFLKKTPYMNIVLFRTSGYKLINYKQ